MNCAVLNNLGPSSLDKRGSIVATLDPVRDEGSTMCHANLLDPLPLQEGRALPDGPAAPPSLLDMVNNWRRASSSSASSSSGVETGACAAGVPSAVGASARGAPPPPMRSTEERLLPRLRRLPPRPPSSSPAAAAARLGSEARAARRSASSSCQVLIPGLKELAAAGAGRAVTGPDFPVPAARRPLQLFVTAACALPSLRRRSQTSNAMTTTMAVPATAPTLTATIAATLRPPPPPPTGFAHGEGGAGGGGASGGGGDSYGLGGGLGTSGTGDRLVMDPVPEKRTWSPSSVRPPAGMGSGVELDGWGYGSGGAGRVGERPGMWHAVAA